MKFALKSGKKAEVIKIKLLTAPTAELIGQSLEVVI
jgi:hypothetical protein